MDTPTLSVEDATNEAIYQDLWLLRQAMAGERQEERNYVCPSARWMPLLEQARALFQQAEEAATAEVPERMRTITNLMVRGDKTAWTSLALKEPEARRLLQVYCVKQVIDILIGDLANEGRPKEQKPNLKLAKTRAHTLGHDRRGSHA